jgi:FtsP/CotA-like multicopper oxidase with cupredoxin domain
MKNIFNFYREVVMKKIYFMLLISCLTLLLTPFKLMADTASPVTSATNNVSFLFVQSAGKATLKFVNGQVGTYQLTLQKVHPYITYFSDRPYRKIGLITLQQYLNMWQTGPDSFQKNPPNADISAIRHEGLLDKHVAVNFPVQLVGVSYDPKAQTFTYTIRALPGSVPIPSIAKFGYIAMTIDGGTCTCCISGTCVF